MCFHHIGFVQYTSFNELVLRGLWKRLRGGVGRVGTGGCRGGNALTLHDWRPGGEFKDFGDERQQTSLPPKK